MLLCMHIYFKVLRIKYQVGPLTYTVFRSHCENGIDTEHLQHSISRIVRVDFREYSGTTMCPSLVASLWLYLAHSPCPYQITKEHL